MTQQRILWTTFPNGARPLDDGNVELRFSLLASPRLTSDTGLLVPEFPVFEDWPAHAGALPFNLEIRAGATTSTFAASPDAATTHTADSTVWKKLFGVWTTVATHDFDDHSADPVLSYPEAALLSYIRGVYGDTVLAAPNVPPNPDQWQGGIPGLPEFWRFAEEDRSAVIQDLRSLLASQRAITASDLGDDLKRVTVHDMFLGTGSPIETSIAATDPPETPQFDFHEAVAVATQYPMLQRLLGLVIDLVAIVPPGVAGNIDVDVRVVSPDDPSDIPLLPWTRATLGRTGFWAKPLDPALLGDGKLLVGDRARFTPVTVDLDGATMKLLSHAASIVHSANRQSPEALAALRSGGVGVAMKDRGKVLADALLRAKNINASLTAGSDVVLFAEDLVRGYRIDVWEDAYSRWSSLMARRGTLRVGPPVAPGVDALPLVFQLDDEGLISTNPTEDAADPGTLRLPESLFAWTGWSLATAQPGSALDNPEVNGSGGGVKDPDEDDEPQSALDVTVSAQPATGSLPVLRFGQEYRVRARTVDAVGNGPGPEPTSPDDEHATDPFRYRRFEPVAAPEVLLTAPRTEGETIERIVIRSEGPFDAEPGHSDRHIAPAKSSWQMAETHGLLDRFVNGRPGPDPAKYAALYPRERGGFGSRTSADGSITVSHPNATPEPNTSGEMYYYAVNQVAINYLPDPLARGATFSPLPGTVSGGVIPYDAYSFEPFDAAGVATWPDYSPFRLSLRKGLASPEFGTDRVLSVFLDKAEVAEVRLSSNLVEGDQDLLGVYGWVEAKVRESFPQFEEALRLGVAAGLVWALTPYRTLTLVHAVRVPLAAPRLANLTVLRTPGDTFARIVGTVDFHRKSTSRIDVVGSWVDCIDDPDVSISDPATDFERPATAPAFSVEADRLTGTGDQLDDALQLADRHEFGDTRHRMVSYQATAVSRFTEYFVERLAHLTGSDPNGTDLVPIGKSLVQGSVVVKTAGGSRTFAEGTDFTVDHATGQIVLPLRQEQSLPGSKGVPINTTLDIAYLPTPHSVLGDVSQTVTIPSSARPEPPRVEYVIPTFAWNPVPAPGGGDVVSFRFGKTVRIYLDRPWYSSGCGEQLGVIFWQAPKPVTAVFPDAPDQVTHWALDPLYDGPSLPAEWPGPASFPLASSVVGQLLLPEFKQAEIHRFVGVAAHDVQFDVTRQKWFCDVAIETGFAYSPFIRLSLARYQQHSIAGFELSQVVRADYAQVAPDRAATLVFQDATRVLVSLYGIDAPTATGPGIAEAWVEEKDPGVPGNDLGWNRVGGVINLARSIIPGPPAGITQWQGRVKLRSNGLRRRVVIQQYEQFRVEPVGTAVIPQRRLIHSDVIEI